MKNFFTLLLIVGIFGSVASVLSDGSSLGKYVRYISALVCVSIIITPLSSILKGFSEYGAKEFQNNVNDFSEAFETDLEKKALEITENQIKEKIKEKFGIIPTHISIVIDRDEKIIVDFSLNEKDKIHEKEIRTFLEELCE